MSGIGGTFNTESMYAHEVEILTFIGSEFNHLEHEEIKKEQRKAKAKGRRR